ncbi:hypothetical protein MASR1M65_26840 [Saprospiraceae bacterium]|nr:hypothetical protein [Bacteroidia bacterium]
MFTLSQFDREIKNLYKETKYHDLVQFFKENRQCFTIEEIAENATIISCLLNSFRRLAKFSYAILFMDYFDIRIHEKTDDHLLLAYGWLLWMILNHQMKNMACDKLIALDVSGAKHSSRRLNTVQDLEKEIRSILTILPKAKVDYTKALYSTLAVSLLKFKKKQRNKSWYSINTLCDELDIKLLDTKPRTIKTTNANTAIELASDLENWFAFKTQALEKLEKYEECYSLSKESLQTITSLHHSNDIWFARRIALSRKHMGDITRAITDYVGLLKKKNDWFLWKELAELYWLQNNVKLAFECAVKAACLNGKIQYKIGLLLLLGDILYKTGKDKMAFRHYKFIQLIRLKNKWMVPSTLMDRLNKFSESNVEFTFYELQNSLKSFWMSFGFTLQHGKNYKVSVKKKNTFGRQHPKIGEQKCMIQYVT